MGLSCVVALLISLAPSDAVAMSGSEGQSASYSSSHSRVCGFCFSSFYQAMHACMKALQSTIWAYIKPDKSGLPMGHPISYIPLPGTLTPKP